jgi:hypothetical protein
VTSKGNFYSIDILANNYSWLGIHRAWQSRSTTGIPVPTPVNIEMMFLIKVDFCNLFFFFKNLAVEKSAETRTSFRLASHLSKHLTPRPLKDKSEKVVTEDQEMAEVLNEFFSSFFTRENTSNVPVAENMATEEIKTVRITEWEVKNKIRKLRKDAAAGPDEIGPRVLQELENDHLQAFAEYRGDTS